MAPIFIPNSPVWGTLDVDSNGNLFIGGVGPTGQIWCVRSTNAKNGAVIPTFDLSTPVNLGGNVIAGDNVAGDINPVGIVGQITVATDRSGTSTNNNVYMLASVEPFSGSARADVMFARSTNGGQTFSAPIRINDDISNANKWHWFGTMAVAPNGRIDVVWLDTRNAANHTDSQLFYSYSMDGGMTWSANIAVSQPFNPFLGYPNQPKMGDYMQIVSDNSGGHVAYCATFNGEQDIYYVKVGPLATKADFNADHKSDLIWQNNSTGERGIWFMNGTTQTGFLFLETQPLEWQIATSGDFNADRQADLVWQNTTTGQRGFWLMSGTTRVGVRMLPTVGLEWRIAAAGDFNGDGHPDLVWENTQDGRRGIWLMQETNFSQDVFLPPVSTDWQIVGAGDFNANGHTDILWQNKVSGERVVWFMNGTTYESFQYLSPAIIPLDWQIAGTGKFNGDEYADIVWQNTNTGQRGVWLMNGTNQGAVHFFPTTPTAWVIRNH